MHGFFLLGQGFVQHLVDEGKVHRGNVAFLKVFSLVAYFPGVRSVAADKLDTPGPKMGYGR